MKVGDQLAVSVDGHEVGGIAVIEEIENGKAYIVIPATRVVMSIRQTLEPTTPETDRIFGGMAETSEEAISDAAAEVNAEPVPLREQNLEAAELDE